MMQYCSQTRGFRLCSLDSTSWFPTTGLFVTQHRSTFYRKMCGRRSVDAVKAHRFLKALHQPLRMQNRSWSKLGRTKKAWCIWCSSTGHYMFGLMQGCSHGDYIEYNSQETAWNHKEATVTKRRPLKKLNED